MAAHVSPATLMAVVKADAYGHGAVEVGAAALSHGASQLSVYAVSEGVLLRQGGITAPILVFGPFSNGEATSLWKYNLTPTVSCLESATRLQAAANGRTLSFHLKVDTGLARAGIEPRDVVPFLRSVAQLLPDLHHAGTYTHFASADEPDKTTTQRQIRMYREVLGQMEHSGFPVGLTHTSNSAALLEVPEARFEMVRAGIATYGYYPGSHTSRTVSLVPAMQVVSEVIRVHPIAVGAGVGYGHEFRADRPTTIALVPIGYGDGLPRTLGQGVGRVLIRSHPAPIVGRVSMDQITVDVTDIEGVSVGDQVVLVGAQGQTEQSADDLAAQAGTISYDLLTGLLSRVPRVYVAAGELVPNNSGPRA